MSKGLVIAGILLAFLGMKSVAEDTYGTAELVAEMYGISRAEMDELALRSHHNVERATSEGAFRDEIVPVEVPQKRGKPPVVFERDEHFRPGITMDDLAALPPAFAPEIGKVTAGNSSGINDGASAMVIMSAMLG